MADSFALWAERHNTNLTSLTQCIVFNHIYQDLCQLPCCHLRELHLVESNVQLEPAGGYPGVLHHCTGLAALHLEDIQVQHLCAAFAAITALPELRSLSLERLYGVNDQGISFAGLGNVSKLTSLGLAYENSWGSADQFQQLGHLSALVNLEHLNLFNLLDCGVPGGIPSQLVKLTCLHLVFENECKCSELLQHLGSLTALCDFKVQCTTAYDDALLAWPVLG
jgi:hypothetical protein